MSPKKSAQKLLTDLSQNEIEARQKNGVALDAPLTAQEITAREAEKASTLASLQQSSAPLAPATTDLISRFIAAGVAPTITEVDQERAEVERLARPLLTRARSCQTALGILQTKWTEKVLAAAGTDWAALRKGTPELLVWTDDQIQYKKKVARMQTDVAGAAITRYERAVNAAKSALSTVLNQAPDGKYSMDAVSLAHAETLVTQMLPSTTNWVTDKSLDGRTVRVLSASFRRGLKQLEYYLDLGEAAVSAAHRAVQEYQDAQQHLTNILAQLEPQIGVRGPATFTIPAPPVVRESARGGTSYQDWDVFAPETKPADPGIRVEKVQGGYQVSGGSR
jgi:hypothetical protein